MLKAVFILKIFTFWQLFAHLGNGLIRKLLRKLRLISKFITSKTGQQITTIHILPNISRNKDN